MPLRIDLKPFERLIINGATIRNGDRRCDLLIETQSKFLRESEIIRESEVDTPCKQLWMTMQVIHLSDDTKALMDLLYAQANEILTAMPSAALYMAAIHAALEERHTHKAIKFVKQLVAHEQSVLDARGRTRVASAMMDA